MSLGYIPIILTIILSEFTTIDKAVYIGAATGLLFTIIYFYTCKPQFKHVISASSTIILVLFSIIAIIMGPDNLWPQKYLPFTLEVAMIFPLLLLFLNRKKYYLLANKAQEPEELKIRTRMKALSLSSVRMFFMLVTIHFGFITVGLIFTRSLENGFMWFLIYVGPLIVFILSVLIGYLEIRLLQTVEDPEYIPVVTPEGNVVGKVDKSQAEEYKNGLTNPIIRIATVSHNMLFLCKRPANSMIDVGKIDIPLETYLLFKEDINKGVERLLKETFPDGWNRLKPDFSIKYKFKNQETDRIVYLFILDLGMEDEILNNPKFEGGKLWTFQQIDYNLGQNYFSEMFENEYDHLTFILDTREKYKEFSPDQERDSSTL